jgi:pilus assembly protein CpaE
VLPTILVVDHDLDVLEKVRQLLSAEGYEVVTSVTGQAGIVLAELNRPRLVLLDVDLPDVNGYEVCRTLRSMPSAAKIPILIYSARTAVEDKVAGFKVGANDYIVKPVADAELMARIRAALRSGERTLAHIIALWGAKGGVGTTTLALNLAVALHTRAHKRVTLMDASILGGTLAVMLNLAPQHTVADLLPRLDQLDSELLSSVLATHSSGVRVLASQPWSQNGNSVQPTELERILSWLQEANDYVIVDTAPSLDQSTLAVLQLSAPVLVLTPEMTTLRNAHFFLDLAETWNMPQKVILALNRYPIKGGIELRDVEAALQCHVDVQIPYDEPLVTYSINRGIPLVLSHPRSAVAQGLYQLADAVIARAAQRKATAAAANILSRGNGTEYRREQV